MSPEPLGSLPRPRSHRHPGAKSRTDPRRSRFCHPAFPASFGGLGFGLVYRLEVGGERWAGFDGDDAAVVLPDVVEQAREELAPLGWVGLGVPEAGEVAEEFLGAVEVWVGWWGEALQLFLQGLAAHDVAGLGEVPEDVGGLAAGRAGRVARGGGPGRVRGAAG